MEENIKRVEKLVHATNSALAQMKFSLMFDDINGGKNGRTLRPEGLNRMLLDKFLNGDDLRQCQKEFQLEANKILVKVEEMFNTNESNRKNSKALDRIKEINKEISSIRLEQSKPEETEQSRQKLLDLINDEKFSPGVTSSRGSVGSKRIVSFNREKESLEKTHPDSRKTGSLFSITKSPNRSKEELKNKILETQEIVDRGFLTAKQMAQKVECMTKWDRKEKTPSTDKTISENNLTSLEKKTESNETIKTVKCGRHSVKEKKKERIVRKVEQDNTQVIDVKKKEFQSRVKSNLQLQRLPSVHIRGGLKLQKIHNLEIPANEETTCEKLNTAVSFLSHEQMEKKKMEKIVEKVTRENCYCVEDNIRRNYVECFNCGKLNRVRNTWTDPTKIDEILHQCNFNVFDPRIDEFVEKFETVDFKNLCEKTQTPKTFQSGVFIPDEPKAKSKDVDEKTVTKDQGEQLKKNTRFTLREFSNQVFKKYKQEIETLEDSHLKLDSILQNLFSEVEESKKLFEDCHFFKNLNGSSEKIPNLTSTKPILVTLTGNSFKNRKRQKNLNKKDMSKTKNRTESSEIRRKRKKIFYTTSSPTKLSEAENTREGVLSLNQLNQNRQVKPNTAELSGRFIASLTGQTQNNEHLESREQVEEKLSSVTSTSASMSRNANQVETGLKKNNTEKTLVLASIQRKTAKSLDGIYSEEKFLNRSFVTAFSTINKMTKLSDTKKEKLEGEKTPIVTSVSSNKSSGTCREDLSSVQSKTVKNGFKKKDAEIESLVTSSRNKIDSETEETTSERSENIYESDFESFTNEFEEKGNECEDEKPELIPLVKKLSTISEVDSESEKKLSNEQKATKSPYFETDDSRKAFEMSGCIISQQEKNLDLLRQKKSNSVISEISSKSKKTSETSLKSTPTELMTSLKDILSALQDQFAKTESLAEKLTENVKMDKKEKADSNLAPMMLNTWEMAAPDKIVENLQSARKNWTCFPKLSQSLNMPEKMGIERSKKSEKDLSADSLSDEGGSSLGEIIVSDRRRINSGKSESSSISESNFLNLDNAKRSICISSGRRKSNIGLNFDVMNSDLNFLS